MSIKLVKHVTLNSQSYMWAGPDRPSISVALQGMPVQLSCSSPCQSPSTSVSWTLDFRPLPLSSSSASSPKYVMTSQGDLIVFNVTQDDKGMYRCLSQTTPTVVLATQYVNVTGKAWPDIDWFYWFYRNHQHTPMKSDANYNKSLKGCGFVLCYRLCQCGVYVETSIPELVCSF